MKKKNNHEIKLKLFLEKETKQKIVNNDDNLIDRGVIDSFVMIKFINYIEQEFKVEVEIESLNANNFNTINKIIKLIKRWQQK